ncbi:MAG TPA: hypothetical protein VFN67_26600 [Polyangiales bacterium]|jgi:hypothetical protein|nr:hypothetical protein [Polyangiales bacterium]
MEAQPSTDSNDQLLDAAITILAKHGIAGLTHHAVDEASGCARGTTASRYATQRELLEAAAYRMVLVDALELTGFRASAAGIAAVVERTFSPDGRRRLLARLELFLYAARNPDFMTMHSARDIFAAGAEAHIKIAGAKAPRMAAEAVIAIVDGLSLHDLVTQRMTHRERFALIRRMLRGVLDQPNGGDRL